MNYIIYFFIYSFIGFLIETVYAFAVDGHFSVRRSMVKSPLCIVYGVGAAALVFASGDRNVGAADAFCIGFLVCSAAEYGMSLLYEKICGVLLWDYSGKKANLNGRVCMRYSLYWGIIGILFFLYVHPIIKMFVGTLSEYTKIMLITIFGTYFIKDLKITVREMRKLGRGEKSECSDTLSYIVQAPKRTIY